MGEFLEELPLYPATLNILSSPIVKRLWVMQQRVNKG